MVTVKKKTRGKCERPDVHRAKILLYIAQHPDTKITDIRDHIIKELGIGTRGSVDIQLNKLIEDKVVCKKDIIKISNDHCRYLYAIYDTFHAFRSSYDLLSIQGHQRAFMESPYFEAYLMTNDFRRKFAFNTLKNGLLKVDEQLKSEDSYRKILENVESSPFQVSEETHNQNLAKRPKDEPLKKYEEILQGIYKRGRDDHEQFLKNIKALGAGDTSNQFVRKYDALIQDIKQYEADELSEAITARLNSISYEGMIIDHEKFQTYLATLMLPDHECDNIVRMLKLSPLAINYALAPSYPDPELLAYITGYMINEHVEPSLFKNIAGYDITSLNEGENVSPMYAIIKYRFITDLTSNTLIKSQSYNDILTKILSQHKEIRIRTANGDIRTVDKKELKNDESPTNTGLRHDDKRR